METYDLLEASIQLPFPTGLEITFEESTKLIPSKDFFKKYSALFNITRSRKDDIPSETELDISLNLNTPLNMYLFSYFLKEVQNLKIPAKRYYLNFADMLNEDRLMDDITAKHITSLFANLKLIVDSHNLYLETLNKYVLSKAVINYNMANMLEVSKNPSNLLEAHTSVDSTTGALKKKAASSSEAAEITTRTPGNAINKFEGINENQVGKDGISICATGLKSFFGLTQYCNWVLNHGTERDLERLLIGASHEGVMIGGKVYRTLANIKPLDINNVKNSKLFKALSEITQDEDIALTLSALLSLSTDNAKELALSKLNAGTKMLGLYVYGLSIGMEFDKIADILMSPVGNVFKSMLDEDKFAQKDAFKIIDERLFKYFTKGPIKLLFKFDINTDSAGNRLVQSPLDALKKVLLDKVDKKMSVANILVAISKENKPLSEKILEIEHLRGYYNGVVNSKIEVIFSDEAVEVYNLLIDFIEDYVIQADTIWKNESTFNDILALAAGALEMKTLGLVLSLNLGIKNSTSDFLTQLNNLRRAIYDKTGNLEDLVDLPKFAFDDSPYIKDGIEYDSYKDYVIDQYEEVKEAFNIFDVVSKVPHFMGYLQALASNYAEILNSFTFRSVDNLLLLVKPQIGNYTREDKLTVGLLNYCGDYLLKHWMLDTGKLVVIPKGNQAFDKFGELYTLKRDATIQLGTDWGNATFRLWMENEVIPNLKLGIIKPGFKWERISDNKFIKDLGNDLFNKTITKNPTVIYTLPINMLPSTDSERAKFSLYKSQFNDLNYAYQYEVTSYITNLDGTISEKSELASLSIIDLFTYYAMIANGWKLNQSSLVSITEDFLNMGIILEFHDYVTEMDKSGFTLSKDSIIMDELIPYIAPSDSPYSSSAEIIMARNKNTEKRVLMYRLSNAQLNNIREGEGFPKDVFGHYRAYPAIDNLNYFPTGKIDSGFGSQTIKMDYNNTPITIEFKYSLKSGNIISIESENAVDFDKLKDNIKKIPVKKMDKVKIIDVDMLKANIENVLNGCSGV